MKDMRFAIPSLLLVAVLAWPSCVRGQIGFADNQADRFRLWNAAYYELAFRKADGRLLYILDKTTGQQVSPGNVHGPWVLRFANGTWLDGQNFSPTNPARQFSYTWDPQAELLTLHYDATGTYACDVTITIRPTDGPEVDTDFTLTSQASFDIDLLAYPVQLSFQRSQAEAVYVPYLEGMRLLPSFFSSQDFSGRYPGRMFGDFAHTELTSGSFALYGLQDPQVPLQPVAWKILRDDNYAGGVNKYHHDYEVAIQPLDTWTAPTIVLSVGSTLDEAMDAYWTRSGHAGMPTLADKLGPDLLEQLAGAVLLKRDFLQGNWTFSSFRSFMPNLPAGNLLHLVAFWPNAFDEHYPDYLPPNPALGTLSEFQNLVTEAQAAGHLVMPYTNPTWWDDQSPTLATLGTDIVTRDRGGSLIYEFYNGRGGYVVSPHDPAVIARQDQTRDEFTQTVPCDFLFEDQVGARDAPTYAAHPDAPDPLAYTQGLVDVAARSAQWLPIMTEGGSDRLAWHETGFCNSHTIGWHWWPASTYTAYPLTPLWAHEHLYFSPHNLAGTQMSNDLASLTYYLALGYGLSHDLSAYDADWLTVLDTVQKHIVARTTGVGMTSFEELPGPGRTRTTFANGVTITANRNIAATAVDNHVVAPDGFVALQDGHVLGGVLTVLHGQPLAGSAPHYLAFDYADATIAIHQPRGDDGPLTLPRPADWPDDDRIRLDAVTASGATLEQPLVVAAGTLQFDYLGNVAAQSVDHYRIVYCRWGDADCDGDVDTDDYTALANCLAGPDVPPTPPADCRAAFDEDVDDDVDLSDLGSFQSGFTGAP
jgi:hypothetical protein